MSLDDLRNEIDSIDSEIGRLLSRRLDISRAIGEEKLKNNMPVENLSREQQVILAVQKYACGDKEKEEAISKIYQEIFITSKSVQNKITYKFGLLGRKLGYSVSDIIHKEISNCQYNYYEKEPESLAEFLKTKDFDGINVTIPYKQDVMPYLDIVDDTAKKIGAVNTIVNNNGKLIGYNTDAFGFEVLLKTSGIDVKGKNCIVLGSGGASKAVCFVLNKLNAEKVTVISRTGENNYSNVDKNAEIIVNATPVGMAEYLGETLVNVKDFPKLSAAVDLIYSPVKTRFLQEAKLSNIKAVNGLMMLTAQGVYANLLFRGENIDENSIMSLIYKVYSKLLTSKNIVFIGMPGSGKTTIGAETAKVLGKNFVDIDQMIMEKYGKKPSEILIEKGEEYFRTIEMEVTKEAATMANAVIATGGGVVTREANYYELSKNALICYLDRPISMLCRTGRPLSAGDKVYKLFEERKDKYEKWADLRISI